MFAQLDFEPLAQFKTKTMQWLYIAAGVIGAAAFLYVARDLYRGGVFRKLKIRPKRFHGERVIVRTVVGPYRKIGDEYNKLLAILKEIGFDPVKDKHIKTVGIYHDDPYERGEDKCRSSVGICLNSFKDSKEIEEKLQSKGFTTVSLPAADSLYVNFPIGGILSLMMNMYRLYGKGKALDSYMKLHPTLKSEAAHYEFCTFAGAMDEFYFPLGEKPDEVTSLEKGL